MENETSICVFRQISRGVCAERRKLELLRGSWSRRGQKNKISQSWQDIRIRKGKWRGKLNSRPRKGPLQLSPCGAYSHCPMLVRGQPQPFLDPLLPSFTFVMFLVRCWANGRVKVQEENQQQSNLAVLFQKWDNNMMGLLNDKALCVSW